MKRRRKIFSFFRIASLVLITALPARAFVSESETELLADGDFDGDGRSDIVIVDRETGDYRLGYQLSAGNYTWVGSRASGVENVSGLAVGKLLNLGRDALAFTSPEANRINVIDASSTTTAGVPVSVYPSATGLNLVTAINIGGVGDTAHDDLFVGSIWNDAPLGPNRLNLIRNNGVTFSPISTNIIAQPLALGNRVKVTITSSNLVGVVLRGTADDTFSAYDLSTGVANNVVGTNGLPIGVDYVSGAFNTASTNLQFLFFKPGQSNLIVRPIQQPLQFGPATTFNLGNVIRQVYALPGPTNTKLLIVFGLGESAGVYDFNGVSAPSLVQSFAAPSGQLFTGAAILGNNGFMAFSGDGISKRSSNFQNWSFNGSSYVAGASGALSPLNKLSSPSNVLLFQFEPFVNATPNLLKTLNAGDWVSALTLGGGIPPNVSVQAESFAGTTQGLRNPTPAALGQAPLLTQYGLINQYTSSISLFSYSRPVGDEVVEVNIAPPSGTYKAGVKVSLISNMPGAQVFYRQSLSNAWQTYSVPFNLFKDTTVQYYAKPPAGTSQSAIHSATYQFAAPPSLLDSDGDGVPDYVEIAKGLDPKSGNDHDKDGFFDLDELTSGFDPNNAASHPPTNHVRLELKASFDVVQTPRPFDGTANSPSLASTGTVLRAFGLQGDLLSFGACSNLGLAGVTNPAARLSNIVLETQARLIAVATEQHFDIATLSPDKRIGRELLGLLAVPDLPAPLNVPYSYGGGTLSNEANAWIVAASNAVKNLPRTLMQGDLDVYDTLGALLVEKKIGDLLVARGESNGVNLTLFPFRPSDLARTSFQQDTLLSLEDLDGTQPGYRLQNIYSGISNSVQAAASVPVQNLRKLATDIYRLSSASNNVPPGCTNCPVYPSPVDVLRDFLRTGTLESNYLAHTMLSGAELTSASTGVNTILAAVGSRPTTTIVLRVRPDSFDSGCSTLETTDGLTLFSLFHSDGTPFHFPESFDLAPGSQVLVFGYADLTSVGCAGTDVEVITIKLLAVPLASGADTNGDLLYDDWAALFGSSPFGDDDGDGFSNLQEMFDGTDPKDALSHSSIAADLTPPAIDIEVLPGGTVRLDWSWSPAYENRIRFGARYTDELATVFTDTLVAPTSLGGGNYEANLTNPGTTKRFYTVYMLLR